MPGRYFGMFIIAVLGILALVWIEHQSGSPGTKFTVGYSAGMIPPFLLSASGGSQTVSGGPTSGPSASLVTVPDVQIPINSGWGG